MAPVAAVVADAPLAPVAEDTVRAPVEPPARAAAPVVVAGAGAAGATAVRLEAAPGADGPDGVGGVDEDEDLDDDEGGGHGGGRRPIGRFWTYGFPALIVVFVVLLPVLFTAGKNAVLQSTDGRVLGTVTDPAAPGYQAITEPTDTLLLVQTDAAGVPNGLTVLSLTGEASGGMIFIPMTTVLELPGFGNIPLDAAYERAGLEGLQKAVEGVLGVGMADVAVVGPDGWADLVAPLGTVEVANPDDVKVIGPDGQKAVLFPKGTITLTPDQVAPYLETLSPGENGVNRLVRHQAFWDAWLRKVGISNDPNVVPGESTSGLGHFVRALAADQVDMAPLPVTSASIPGSDLAVYVPIPDQVTSLVARLVPFPIGAPPGARPRVRLLDGVGTLDHGLGAVANVVAAGGQVDQIGNADPFGVAGHAAGLQRRRAAARGHRAPRRAGRRRDRQGPLGPDRDRRHHHARGRLCRPTPADAGPGHHRGPLIPARTDGNRWLRPPGRSWRLAPPPPRPMRRPSSSTSATSSRSSSSS